MRSEDLRYFLAVASAGKLGSAGDLLGISQPGLTKAIGRLEAEIGGPLFRRTGRGMELTELGIGFEQRARRISAELDYAMAEARSYNPQEGVIRLGIAPVLEPMALNACSQFIRNRPLVRIELMVQITDYLELGLSGGRIDVALASESGLFAEELSFQPMAKDEIRIAVSPDHPLAKCRRALTLDELVPYAWALPSRDTAMRRHICQTFVSRGLPEPNVRIENEYGTGILTLSAQSGLLTLCNPYVFQQVPKGTLTTLTFSDFSWKRRVGLLSRRGFPLAPVTKDFVEQLMATEFADLSFGPN